MIDLEILRSVCRNDCFGPGQILRRRGQHYRDMYVIVDGCVGVNRETGALDSMLVVSESGSPIGEISYLRGCPATATVTAQMTTNVLVLDDPALARLEHEHPARAADFLRCVAETAEERLSHNLIWDSDHATTAGSRNIEVYLCRNDEMLDNAKRLRYEVYCQELGRNSPNADHGRKIISDRLDDTALVFIAVEAGETIGTLRANASSDTALGVIEELYGMKDSVHHPDATGICTKFIIKKSKRGGFAAMKLIAAVVRYGLRNDIKECYIDCIPALLPYYKSIGFKPSGPAFFHRENGLSYPMRLDVTRYGNLLSKEASWPRLAHLIVKAKVLKFIDRMRHRDSRRHPEPANVDGA
jgi:N-acyl-L-homoserine lactone synthetase